MHYWSIYCFYTHEPYILYTPYHRLHTEFEKCSRTPVPLRSESGPISNKHQQRRFFKRGRGQTFRQYIMYGWTSRIAPSPYWKWQQRYYKCFRIKYNVLMSFALGVVKNKGGTSYQSLIRRDASGSYLTVFALKKHI